MKPLLALTGLIWTTALAVPSIAGTIDVAPREIVEWKAVYGRVEARDLVPARARIGGVIVELGVSEGDEVTAGEQIGLVRDDKISFQIAALDAQLAALQAQLRTAENELARGETLLGQGVVTKQRLDQLRTNAEVVTNQIASTQANREVLVQQQAEGAILAPAQGRVLSVPQTRGAVIMPGEPVANIGSGGIFLRLAIPERFATSLVEGAEIRMTTGDGEESGRLAKVYPQIENGRVIADVEVESLDTGFVNARVLVEVPVGTRHALMVPQAAIETRNGLDFVRVEGAGGPIERVVVIGRATPGEDSADGLIEVISGLKTGDKVIVDE